MPSRRSFLSSLVAAPFVLNAALRAQAQADLDVAIIGAGAAGLVAAHAAREKGLSARIFEARNRVGGRIVTNASLGPAYDAGAFYIHYADRNPWSGIAAKLGVPTMDDNLLSGGFDVFRNGKPLPPEERGRRRGAFGRLSAGIDREGADVDLSFADAARRYVPEVMDAANGMSLLSLGEEPGRVSVRDYQRLDSGDDLVVPTGYGNLLRLYAEGLDIALSTPVSVVDYSGAGVVLDTPRGRVKARRAIITVPVSLLQAEAIRFTPALPQTTQTAIHGLGMGALTKVALHFEGARFGLSPWTQYFDQGEGGDLINFEFWPFDRNLVIAFFGGDYARSIAKLGEEGASRAILDRLVAILGEEARRAYRGGRLAGWSESPFSRGSYSIAKPGQAGARDVLAQPVAERLFFAGEATAGSASMTAGGAAIAAQRAIAQIAELK